MSTPYYGYQVQITAIDDAHGRVTFSYRRANYTVDWSAAQTGSDVGFSVHVGDPTTISRAVNATGMLYLNGTYCAHNAGLDPSLGDWFEQQPYHLTYVTAYGSAGRYGTIYLNRQQRSFSIDWADRTVSWVKSPSTLTLDANGYPNTNQAGWLCLSDSILNTFGGLAGSPIKWPAGLSGPISLNDYVEASATCVSSFGPLVSFHVHFVDHGTQVEYSTPNPLQLAPTDLTTTGELKIYPDPKYSNLRFENGAKGTLWLNVAWVESLLFQQLVVHGRDLPIRKLRPRKMK